MTVLVKVGNAIGIDSQCHRNDIITSTDEKKFIEGENYIIFMIGYQVNHRVIQEHYEMGLGLDQLNPATIAETLLILVNRSTRTFTAYEASEKGDYINSWELNEWDTFGAGSTLARGALHALTSYKVWSTEEETDLVHEVIRVTGETHALCGGDIHVFSLD